jgi:D-arabinose 1-dehydrogenase-like Zn-dependent alcohol dehydrogenase
MQAKARHTFMIPDGLDIKTAAPLMCVGVAGYRALKFNTTKG